MAYHTELQLESELKTSFDANTTPTTSKVEEIIAETDQEVDSRVGVRYLVPITDATDLLLIRRISIAISTERLRGIMQVLTGNKSEEQDPLSLSGTKAREMLDQIVLGDLTLLSTDKRTTHDGVEDYNFANDIEGTFKTDVEQW